jgi:hypothetical protein
MLFLGAFHGLNPGMGWLFAVALGMQRGTARGVWSALPPLALGHLVAVGGVILVAALLKLVIPLSAFKPTVALLLVAFGVFRLWRHRHPRFGGMQVGFRDLSIWSFLMATAHGAGFMLLPFVTRLSPGSSGAGREAHAGLCHLPVSAFATPWHSAAALGLHTLAYLGATTLAAWLVYRKLGLALLRTAWFNLDWLWAGALLVTGLSIGLIW